MLPPPPVLAPPDGTDVAVTSGVGVGDGDTVAVTTTVRVEAGVGVHGVLDTFSLGFGVHGVLDGFGLHGFLVRSAATLGFGLHGFVVRTALVLVTGRHGSCVFLAGPAPGPAFTCPAPGPAPGTAADPPPGAPEPAPQLPFPVCSPRSLPSQWPATETFGLAAAADSVLACAAVPVAIKAVTPMAKQPAVTRILPAIPAPPWRGLNPARPIRSCKYAISKQQ